MFGVGFADAVLAAEELSGYKTELWRQEKLLNNAIYNMESALNVDMMLQQQTAGHVTASDSNTTVNHQLASTYAHLRDLPLLMRSPMEIQVDEFDLYRSDFEKAPSHETLVEGAVNVKVYCGHGLKSSSLSLRKLYCVLQLDAMKMAKTSVSTGAINFDWDEGFDMSVGEGATNLVCMIYHFSPSTRHRLCFTGSIRLSKIFSSDLDHQQRRKCALRLEPRGILYLEITFSPHRHDDQSSTGGLFGRSIKDTLAIENSSTNVPIIVTKCVNEVNRRGLSVASIYRRCGDTRMRRGLRQAFERHAHLVDLSPASVPDIHDVTGQ